MLQFINVFVVKNNNAIIFTDGSRVNVIKRDSVEEIVVKLAQLRTVCTKLYVWAPKGDNLSTLFAAISAHNEKETATNTKKVKLLRQYDRVTPAPKPNRLFVNTSKETPEWVCCLIAAVTQQEAAEKAARSERAKRAKRAKRAA